MNRLLYFDGIARALAQSISHGAAGMDNVPGLLRKVIEEGMWRERTIPESGEIVHFDRFIDFVTAKPLEGLGTTIDTLRALCKQDEAVLKELNRLVGEEVEPVHLQAETGRGKTSDMSEVSQLGGNSRDYTIARLKRDNPDIAQRVINGEISAAEGRRLAGWEKHKVAVRMDDPASAASTIAKHMVKEQINELISLLLACLDSPEDK